jgi:D-tyrosyl-tRNA(Tyr) deacylase
MRVVVQRVRKASVTIEGSITAAIHQGLAILVGIEDTDTKDDIAWLARKIVNLRIFDDPNGVMNLSVKEITGDIMIVSQFTLMASTCKGNRPSYIRASKHAFAIPMYNMFCEVVAQQLGKPVQTGTFAADMQVALVNDGPVTIVIDTKLKE